MIFLGISAVKSAKKLFVLDQEAGSGIILLFCFTSETQISIKSILRIYFCPDPPSLCSPNCDLYDCIQQFSVDIVIRGGADWCSG